MIDRYTLTKPAKAVQVHFALESVAHYAPLYNAAPGSLLPVILQEDPRGLSWFYWGHTPAFAKGKPMAERLLHIPTEKLAPTAGTTRRMLAHRCLVPADGFYVWKTLSKKSVIPHRVTLAQQGLFAIAAVWEEYAPDENGTIHTFRILTQPAPPSLASLCARVPSVVDPAAWMNPIADTDDLLGATRENHDWISYTVSHTVYHSRANDERFIQPAPPANQHGNLTLFD